MPTLQEKREKRANIWAQAQEFRTRSETGEMTAEDSNAWDKALGELDDLSEEIERDERTDGLAKRFGQIDEQHRDAGGGNIAKPDLDDALKPDEKYQRAFASYIRYGMASIPAEDQQMLRNLYIDAMGDQGRTVRAAQGIGSGAIGGYTVPTGFWDKVTETMKWYGGVMQAGPELLNTSTGNPFQWPTNDDTSNVGAILSENTQLAELDLTFGQKQLNSYTYTSKLILASWQFLQDTEIDAEGFIARKIGERLGRIYNTHQTNGTGSSQPQGIITGSTTGKTTASATAITYGEIVDLLHSVDIAYRNIPNSGFMMHDLILAYVRKLLDSQNRPLWEPSLQAGIPGTLLGYKYTVNNDMDSTVATTKKTMAFGSMQAAYVVRTVSGGQVIRLDERYADYLQSGFFGFGRMDGLVQDSSAVKLLVQT